MRALSDGSTGWRIIWFREQEAAAASPHDDEHGWRPAELRGCDFAEAEIASPAPHIRVTPPMCRFSALARARSICVVRWKTPMALQPVGSR
jgi:hypothetical protein